MDGIVLFLFIWIVGTFLNMFVAFEKGRPIGSTILTSLLVSPVVAYLYLLAVPSLAKRPLGENDQSKVEQKVAGGDLLECNRCKKQISTLFIACPYCERVFRHCPDCKKPLDADFKRCPYCDSNQIVPAADRSTA